MYPVCRRLLQIRHYKTVRVSDGLTKLRDTYKRDKEIYLKKEEEKKSKAKAAKEAEAKKVAAEPPLVVFKLKCPGCGAGYQYKDVEKAGYLQYNKMMSWDSTTSLPCERCEKVSDSQYHQMYSIKEDRFKRMLEKIANSKALGIIVCDIIGFPSALPPDLGNIDPVGTPVILCLNKCDILASTPGQLEIVQQYYRSLITKWEKLNKFKFSEVMFVSGRTGLGLPELSLHVQQYMYGKKKFSDIDFCYLLGVTNAGKSTLFNKLSPLLNSTIRCIGNVTESPLPGTTVSNISSVIRPPPKANLPIHKQPNTAEQLNKRVYKLEKLITQAEMAPNLPDNDTFSAWFKSKIDLQLEDKSDKKMLIDTPGVLPDNAVPEASYACQHKVYLQMVELDPGQCLSFGWYKIYYVRGNMSIKLGINSPAITNHEIQSDVSDTLLYYTESGVKLCNKLYVIQSINTYTKSRLLPGARTGDICFGNFGWVSVNLAPGDDVTVIVFGPRLEDINYRTPGFHLRVPWFRQFSRKKVPNKKFNEEQNLVEHPGEF